MKKYKYPIITLENFNKVAKPLIGKKLIRCKRFGERTVDDYYILKVRAPRTRNEFFEFTKNMFGEGMYLKGTSYRPEIEHSPTAYENPIFKLWRDKFHEGWRLIGGTAFGNMGTGGWDYASYDYGFHHREKKRIEKMFNSKLSIRYSKGSNQT